MHDYDDDPATTIAGWQLGHVIAHGHHGFPGDPLPGGHLGRPADLAFWGSVFDDDPREPGCDGPSDFEDHLDRLDGR